MKWLGVLKIIGPAVLAANPATAIFAPIIIGGIHLAEESQKSGAEKRELGREAVKLSASTANMIAKRDVVPVDQALSAYDSSVDAIVSVTNIVKAASVQPTGKS